MISIVIQVRYDSKPKNDVDSNDTDMKRCRLYTWLTLQYASEVSIGFSNVLK